MATVIRFTNEIDEPARAKLVAGIREAHLNAETGWDLGDRGPAENGERILAVVNYMADLSKAGTVRISALGSSVNRWIRSVVAADEHVFVEVVDQKSQQTIRFRATDTEVAFRLLKTALATQVGDAPVAWDGLAWSETPPDPTEHPRVFVSYAHESEEHKADVLAFCELLTTCGVETSMDRWSLDARRDWQLWATHQILDADYVIVMASEQCRLVGDGKNEPDKNLGLQSEMRLLRELYHGEPRIWPQRMLPVILPGRSVDEIPYFLQPRTADHFAVESLTRDGVEDLLRIRYRKPPFSPPELGRSPDF